MMLRSAFMASLILISAAFADTLSEKWAKRVESTDEIYQTAVKKADDTRFFAVRKAALERVRLLKSALADATKAGDFDAATELKSRLEAAESNGGVRPKPKNTVKFGGHEYALIEDRVTWHVAKTMCEEMGGHLAIPKGQPEQAFIATLCKNAGISCWLGASDEVVEGRWMWVNGTPVSKERITTWSLDNEVSIEHHLFFYPKKSAFMDGVAGTRFAFVCEFDS